jgi:hypothetical protein
MPFELSKAAFLAKTELLAQAREKHTVVSVQVDAFNAMLDAARESIEGACRDYAAAVAELERFAKETAREQGVALDAQPAAWRESEDGNAARDWIAAYAAFKPIVPKVDLSPEIETLDDELLSHFEELPDSP